MHTDKRKKGILIPGKSPTFGVDDTALTAEAEYSK